MTNDDAIKIALKNELISDIEAYQTLPKYKISLKFDKKMKRLQRFQALFLFFTVKLPKETV